MKKIKAFFKRCWEVLKAWHKYSGTDELCKTIYNAAVQDEITRREKEKKKEEFIITLTNYLKANTPQGETSDSKN